MLKNRHKLDRENAIFQLAYYYEKPKINDYKQKLKEFISTVDLVSFWEQAAWNIPRHGYKVTQATVYCYDKEGSINEIYPIQKKL